MTSYEVPAAGSETELLIKKSRFLARLRRVTSRAEALQQIQLFHTEHPQARHLCWAYLLGPSACSSAAMNDDGEPSGTAGRPILNVIQHKNISDTLVMVVRYFGGIKLGAGGLTRAYSGAAEAVLAQCPRRLYEPMVAWQLRLEFSQEADLRHWLEQHGGQIVSLDYATGVVMQLAVPQSQQQRLAAYAESMSMRLLESADILSS